jgi:hypothetical protein
MTAMAWAGNRFFPDSRTGRAAQRLSLRRTIWFGVSLAVLVVALIVCQLIWPSRIGTSGCWIQLVCWGPFYASLGFNRFAARRFKRELLAADYRVCCFCGYDLRGSPDFGKCPECGEWFDVAVVRTEWESLQRNPSSK